MKKWFENIDLCFTDTDSLLYLIEGQDPYKVLEEYTDYFDFSGYPPKHPCYKGGPQGYWIVDLGVFKAWILDFEEKFDWILDFQKSVGFGFLLNFILYSGS